MKNEQTLADGGCVQEKRPGRGSGAMYIRAVAGDFEQIYDNGMHLGRPISLPAPGGPQSWVSRSHLHHSRPHLESRLESGRLDRPWGVWLETRDRRSAPIRVAAPLERNSIRRDKNFRSNCIPTAVCRFCLRTRGCLDAFRPQFASLKFSFARKRIYVYSKGLYTITSSISIFPIIRNAVYIMTDD